MTSAFQLFFPEQGVAAIREGSVPPPKGNQVLVATVYSGISRGTERLVFSGMVPETSRESMKCPNQMGEFPFPVSYGYSCVGKIADIGPDVQNLTIGDVIFCLHPHHTHFVIDEAQTAVVPSGIPADLAVIAANMETGLNATWDAQLQPDDNVLVIGAGVVGLLTAYLVSREHVAISVTDINPNRRGIVEALGLEFRSAEEINTDTTEYSAIFNTSASGEGLQTAIDKAAFEARIIEMSWYGNKPVKLALGGAFHSKRLKIVSSQVGSVAPLKRGDYTNSERLNAAIKLLADTRLEKLLDPRVAFQDLPRQLPTILDSATDALCPLIEYE